MRDENIQLPGLWDDYQGDYRLFNLRRGAEKRQRAWEIIVEVLKAVSPKCPTRDQLQKLCRIRRKKFIGLLKSLIETGTIHKVGSGTKGDPFVYAIDPKYLAGGQSRFVF